MMVTAVHATRGQAWLAQTARGSLLRTYLHFNNQGLVQCKGAHAARQQKRQVVATLRHAVATGRFAGHSAQECLAGVCHRAHFSAKSTAQ